jgi:ppGpp synthetase/RelA/SpoT-type nucleotidyltranferase
MKVNDFRKQFGTMEKTLQSLEKSALPIIQSAIDSTNITTLPILHRVKSIESAVKKFESKNYTSPFDEMTDQVAFRVITYLESDIEVIESSLRTYFEIDEANSIDKRNGNSPHEVGYRSLHLVCKLGQKRCNLPENEGLQDTPFEIQVRTVLEHAWAEIEHKQNYKSVVALPPSLQRKLNIISGTLELVDSQLAAIAKEASNYSKQVAEKSDDIQSDHISDTALLALVRLYSSEKKLRLRVGFSDTDFSSLIMELAKFGIITISQLGNLLERQSEKIKTSNPNGTTVHGLIRDALIFEDYEKYITECFSNQFYFGYNDVQRMAEVMNQPRLHDFLVDRGVKVLDDEYEEEEEEDLDHYV